jgi:dTDP-4-dehydrorhamnose 3,5-epimerase
MTEIRTNIDGLLLDPRKVIADDRGSVMHMTKASDSQRTIAEVYFSTINPGVTKGWKRHKRMWQCFSVPIGEVEFQFIDERPNSKTEGAREIIRLSRSNHSLITVPPGIWYSFKCTSPEEAMIVNATDIEHDPDESEVRPLDQ